MVDPVAQVAGIDPGYGRDTRKQRRMRTTRRAIRSVPDHEPEAEACFHPDLAVARRRQAKSLGLRAAMRLARLWHRRDKRDNARRLLVEVYGWFTEGLDATDQREAKAPLEAEGKLWRFFLSATAAVR
jgi:hypothetical protein